MEQRGAEPLLQTCTDAACTASALGDGWVANVALILEEVCGDDPGDYGPVNLVSAPAKWDELIIENSEETPERSRSARVQPAWGP